MINILVEVNNTCMVSNVIIQNRKFLFAALFQEV